MTKQFLILLDWYEYNLTGIVRAKNKIKALEKMLLNQINQNKKINKWDLSDNIPNFYYDDDLTDRQNIAKYLKQILNKYVKIPNEENKPVYNTKQYETFKSNLSAYVDNELNANQNIKVKTSKN